MRLLLRTTFVVLATTGLACSAADDASNPEEVTDAVGSGGSGGAPGTSATTSGAGGFDPTTSSSSGTMPTPTTGAGGGCQMPDPGPPAASDTCGDGLDNDLDGFVDEDCGCSLGQTQPCFGGPPTWLSQSSCTKGTQTCEGGGEFPALWGACTGWACGPATPPEICGNDIDDDCDQLVDEGCELEMNVDIDGDCIWVSCPPQAPYPVGCNIVMDGGDSRGCVASTPMSSKVYFKEGDACPFVIDIGDAGHVSGTLTCSTVPGAGLDAQNCPINKPNSFYPPNPSGCPG